MPPGVSFGGGAGALALDAALDVAFVLALAVALEAALDTVAGGAPSALDAASRRDGSQHASASSSEKRAVHGIQRIYHRDNAWSTRPLPGFLKWRCYFRLRLEKRPDSSSGLILCEVSFSVELMLLVWSVISIVFGTQ